MSLSSAQIIEAIGLPPGEGSYGVLMSWRRAVDADRATWDYEEWTFLNELLEHPRPRAERYAHPTAMPKPSGKLHGSTGERVALEPGDLLWIQRLPSDPKQISNDDAAYVASLTREARPGSSDERLLRSILDPIQRFHDRRQAEVELRNLDAATPRSVPRNAQRVLGAAIARETSELSGDEAHTRAGRMIEETTAAATAERQRAQIQARIKELLKP